MIDKVQEAFLRAAATGLDGGTTDAELSAEEWESFFSCAKEQLLLPLIYEAVSESASFKSFPAKERVKWQKSAISTATRQIVQTNELLTLLLRAQARGLDPIVVKGIVCRQLYKKPWLRFSVDEDIFIRPEEGGKWHEFLTGEGYALTHGDTEVSRLAEPSYHREGSPLCIELHKCLFPEDSGAVSGLNRFFEDAYDRTVTVTVEDVSFKTLAPTEHFLFLILHACKHFLYSGFGIRQVMDMTVFIGAYGQQIDWPYIRKCCGEVRADVFAAALLKIAHERLGLREIPAEFRDLAEGIDTKPLLRDMMEGGVYGVAEITRAHSSNITLEAAEKAGGRKPLLPKTLFPGAGYLQQQFPYAKKYPVLLPAAWLHRILRFLVRDRDGRGGDAAETLRVGRERVALLRTYGIIGRK